jgi:hypothetical protein
MSSINEHTGARLISKPNSKEFEDNYDRIFRKSFEVSVTDCELISLEYEYKILELVARRFNDAGIVVSVRNYKDIVSDSGMITQLYTDDGLVFNWTKD